MLFLLLAILSSSLISILMRVSSNRISANLSMLAVNYLICAVLGAGYTGFRPAAPADPGFSVMVLLGIVTGCLYLGGFMLCQYNTRKNGIILTSIFTKLGLLVPVAMSMVLFEETPTLIQTLGFAIAVGAIVVINLKKDQTGNGFGFGLILMLLICGGCDAMSKVYERLGPAALSDSYLFVTFAAAFVLCAALAWHQKEKPGRKELFFGSVIGIPNFFSAKFLLGALTKLPAVVVYPSFSVATLLIVTLTGVAVFRERLSKRQWAALAAIVVALVLLNI
jgi:drug/metabolite transporter (DMT)-like permease